MNTFLPFPDFRKSAECLDTVRLKNQLNECKVIQKAIGGAKAWAHHPATRMWVAWPEALELYMGALADEMWGRGLKLPSWAPETSVGPCVLPIWFGHPAVHESHRRNLLRKSYTHYKPHFKETGGSNVYAWPTKLLDGTWIIRFKEVGAKKYQELTEPILYQGANMGKDAFDEARDE